MPAMRETRTAARRVVAAIKYVKIESPPFKYAENKAPNFCLGLYVYNIWVCGFVYSYLFIFSCLEKNRASIISSPIPTVIQISATLKAGQWYVGPN